MKIQSYKELKVWQFAVDLADMIFEQQKTFLSVSNMA